MCKSMKMLCLTALLFIVGCETSVPVDHDGKPETPDREMSSEQIEMLASTLDRKHEEMDAAAKETAAARLESLSREIERQQRTLLREHDEKIEDLESYATDKAEAINAEWRMVRTQLRESADNAQLTISDAQARLAREDAWKSTIGAVLSDPATGGLLNLIVPGASVAVAGLTSLWGLTQRTKAKTAEKEAETNRRAYVELDKDATVAFDAIDIAKDASPELANAMEKAKPIIHRWQSDGAKALIASKRTFSRAGA